MEENNKEKHRRKHRSGQENKFTIDTEMKAKRDNIISELITLRIAKAKAKENSEGGSNEIHLKLAVMQKY